jgi:hypothetical protein
MDLLSTLPRPDLPSEILIAWVVWGAGGWLLMLWFLRRRATSVALPPPSRPPEAPVRRSGVRTPVRAESGAYGAPHSGSGVRPAASASPTPNPTPMPAPSLKANVRVHDAYAELSSLLDSTNDPPGTH